MAWLLRPPMTAMGRQLVRWLERSVPVELSLVGPGPADVALAAVPEPAATEELAAA